MSQSPAKTKSVSVNSNVKNIKNNANISKLREHKINEFYSKVENKNIESSRNYIK